MSVRGDGKMIAVSKYELWPAPSIRRRWEQIVGLLAPKPGERLLDVGCGAGQAALYVAGKVGTQGSVTALDRPGAAIRRLHETAVQENLGNLEVVAATAEAL